MDNYEKNFGKKHFYKIWGFRGMKNNQKIYQAIFKHFNLKNIKKMKIIIVIFIFINLINCYHRGDPIQTLKKVKHSSVYLKINKI